MKRSRSRSPSPNSPRMRFHHTLFPDQPNSLRQLSINAVVSTYTLAPLTVQHLGDFMNNPEVIALRRSICLQPLFPLDNPGLCLQWLLALFPVLKEDKVVGVFVHG